jgi:prepilin signal peptidase PulO-like enzyme (type II secretory pathway)
MQTPASFRGSSRPPLPQPSFRHPESFLLRSDTLTWLSGLVLSLSTFMSWYSGRADDAGGYHLVLSVIGWHTGLIGQLVFFLGFAVVVLFALRMFGIALPASLPESLIVMGIGVLSTILVLVRLIWVPDKFLPADGRGIGIWIALLAALGVIAAGLIEATEEI